MGPEFFRRKIALPDTIESKAVLKATEEADPSAYSPLPPQGRQEKGKLDSTSSMGGFYRYPVIRTEQDTYVDITKKPANIWAGQEGRKGEPAKREYIIAALLKGIMNVSDIVPSRQGLLRSTHYLSKVMPLSRIQDETYKTHVLPDFALLASIFGDRDHALPGENRVENFADEKGRVAYYDFAGSDFSPAWKPDDSVYAQIEALTKDELALYRQKLRLLKERLDGEEGLAFVQAVLRHGNLNYDAAELRQTFLIRIAGAEWKAAESATELESSSPG